MSLPPTSEHPSLRELTPCLLPSSGPQGGGEPGCSRQAAASHGRDGGKVHHPHAQGDYPPNPQDPGAAAGGKRYRLCGLQVGALRGAVTTEEESPSPLLCILQFMKLAFLYLMLFFVPGVETERQLWLAWNVSGYTWPRAGHNAHQHCEAKPGSSWRCGGGGLMGVIFQKVLLFSCVCPCGSIWVSL